jgi:hypothetical protein
LITTRSSDLNVVAAGELIKISGLSATIRALNVLSETLEIVPLVGPRLKAAAKLCAAICESVKVCDDGV